MKKQTLLRSPCYEVLKSHHSHLIGRVAYGTDQIDWEGTYASVISERQACIQIMPMIFIFFIVDLSWG